MYSGKETCQGCKKTGAERPRWYKEDLCQDCKSIMDLGKSKEVEIKNDYILIRQHWHAIYDRLSDDKVSMNNLLSDILHVIDNPRAKNSDLKMGFIGQYYDNSYSVKIPVDLQEPIKAFFLHLEKVVAGIADKKASIKSEALAEVYAVKNEIYQKGLNDGRNLLIQLNTGQITLDDLNKEKNLIC